MSSVDGIDRARDVLLLAGGGEMSVDEYAIRCAGSRAARAGYLFQARVVQHPALDRLTGGRLAGLRMVVFLGPDGPFLHRVTWRVPVGDTITDQPHDVSGNRRPRIRCCVDPATGRVGRAILTRGAEPPAVYALGHRGRPVEAHPDTGERLTGVVLPDWDETAALCLHAARAFPGTRYQSWDLVVAADGPMVLELNSGGAIQQDPGGRGLNDGRLRELLARAARAGAPRPGGWGAPS